MKKLLTIAAFAAFTSAASAASLTWGFGSASLFLAKPGDTIGVAAKGFNDEIPSGAQLVLVYLGTDTSFDATSVTAAQVVDTIAYGASGDEEESFWNPGTKTFAVTATGGYSANDWFGLAFFDGTKYTAIKDIESFDTGKIGGDLTPTVQITDLDPTKSFSLNPAKASSDGAAAVVVPEPSVALMGLLGLGMLLKRRKA